MPKHRSHEGSTSARRRGKGEGSIFQRSDGRWAGCVTVGYAPDGRQLKKWVYGRTRREAASKLAKLLPKAGSAILPEPSRLYVGAWLEQYAERRGREVRPTTRSHYTAYIRYLEPLHRVRLAALRPLHIRNAYDSLAERGLSPSVRRHVHAFLKSALREATRLELIESNPAEAVDPPPLKRVRPPRAWRPEEAARFLEYARESSRYYALFALMLGHGLRIGETLALRWSDWEGNTLHIRHTMNHRTRELGEPKTASSRRIIYLSAESQELLAKHKLAQDYERSAARSWQEGGWIFPSTRGTPTQYRNIRRHYLSLCHGAGVEPIGLHGLRHTYTTMALRLLPPKVVSEALGHADVHLTLQVYQSLQDEDKKRAAAVSLTDLLNGG